MQLVFIFWYALWWAAASASHIQLRDRDFVGEDPVLAAALERRLARSRPPLELLQDNEPPPGREGVTPSPTNASLPGDASPLRGFPYDSPARGRGFRRAGSRWRRQYDSRAYYDLNAALAAQANAVGYNGNEPTYKEFEKDWNHTNLYAMQLKVAEQSIYGMQMRLTDLERIMKPYTNSRLMRMAYILRRLDLWKKEMRDLYDYSHKKYKATLWSFIPLATDHPRSHDNPIDFPNWRHIMYYEAILKRYIDIIYSVEFVIKEHIAEIEASKKAAEKAETKGGHS